MLRSIALMAATAAMAAAPITAEAAAPRAAAPVPAEAESLRGMPFLLPVLVAIAVALGIILLTDGDDNPVSP
jgi:hypothetical protein